MVMGNANGRNESGGSSGAKNEAGEEIFMGELAHGHGGGAQFSSYYAPNYHFAESMVQPPPHNPRAYQSPFYFTPQVPFVPLSSPNEITQIQRTQLNETSMNHDGRVSGMGIPTLITWIHGGFRVLVKGSWDKWMKEEPLEKLGREFTIFKVLESGVYHFRFIVDGEWRYAPELPQQTDEMGNVFNILDLLEYIPEVVSSVPESEYLSSPTSSYRNSPFTLEDHDTKHLPELPLLLTQMPLSQPLISDDGPDAVQKPLPAVLNHLYVQKSGSDQSTVALSSTQRFREKYVTLVLYKSFRPETKEQFLDF